MLAHLDNAHWDLWMESAKKSCVFHKIWGLLWKQLCHIAVPIQRSSADAPRSWLSDPSCSSLGPTLITLGSSFSMHVRAKHRAVNSFYLTPKRALECRVSRMKAGLLWFFFSGFSLVSFLDLVQNVEEEKREAVPRKGDLRLAIKMVSSSNTSSSSQSPFRLSASRSHRP